MRLGKLVLFLLLISAVASCSKKQDNKEPIFHVDKENINVGNLSKKTPVYHFVIPFKNTGGGELKISDVQPGCYCTTVDFPKGSFENNDCGEIKIEFNTKEVSAQEGFVREFLILSNASNDSVTVYLEGNLYN